MELGPRGSHWRSPGPTTSPSPALGPRGLALAAKGRLEEAGVERDSVAAIAEALPAEAAAARKRFEKAWQRADIELTASWT